MDGFEISQGCCREGARRIWTNRPLRHLTMVFRRTRCASRSASLSRRTLVTHVPSPSTTTSSRSTSTISSGTCSAPGSSHLFLFNTTRTMLISGADLRASDEYKKWQKLGKRRDPEEWEMYPSQVNAYFNPPANEVYRRVFNRQRFVLLKSVFRLSSPLASCSRRSSLRTGQFHTEAQPSYSDG